MTFMLYVCVHVHMYCTQHVELIAQYNTCTHVSCTHTPTQFSMICIQYQEGTVLMHTGRQNTRHIPCNVQYTSNSNKKMMINATILFFNNNLNYAYNIHVARMHTCIIYISYVHTYMCVRVPYKYTRHQCTHIFNQNTDTKDN